MRHCRGYWVRAVLTGMMLALATPLLSFAASDPSVPSTTHESPKSPTGSDGATLIIAVIVGTFVAAGILAGGRTEKGNSVAPRSRAGAASGVCTEKVTRVENYESLHLP